MKSLIITILGLSGSWYITDLSSSNFIYSGLAPFGVFVFLCALLVWLLAKAGLGGKTDSGGGTGGFFGGGDSGGGDGGC